MTLREMIESQSGSETVAINHSGGTATLTRQQADHVLAGGELIIDPLTGRVEVRR